MSGRSKTGIDERRYTSVDERRYKTRPQSTIVDGGNSVQVTERVRLGSTQSDHGNWSVPAGKEMSDTRPCFKARTSATWQGRCSAYHSYDTVKQTTVMRCHLVRPLMVSNDDGSGAPGRTIGFKVTGSVCVEPKRHLNPFGQL